MLITDYSKQALKALRAMQPKQAGRIREAITKLAENPMRTDLDIKPLQGRPYNRLRVGQHRVIFDHNGRVLFIIRVGPRESIY